MNRNRTTIGRLAGARRSSILLIALWSIFLLSVFAVILGTGVRQNIVLVRWLDERCKGRLIAEAGIRRACIEIQRHTKDQFHTLSQAWANNPAEFKDVSVGEGSFSVTYTRRRPDTAQEEQYYGCVDEESKVNVNKASAAVLTRLFAALGLDDVPAQDLAAAIVDWRDADSQLSSTSGGAEDSYYRMLSPGYEAKDADFEIPEELLLVKGMDEKLFEEVRKYITIYGTGKVNINTAPKPVLVALGSSEVMADRIIAYRNGKDATAGSSDDNIFENPVTCAEVLATYYNTSDSDPEYIKFKTAADQGGIAVKSTHFSITSIAGFGRRTDRVVTTCVVDLAGRILYWKES
ncbi:MAG: general secretion pathway protein GspK [Candidatus Omnitrophica bacterium]|nr:general secretion pathway protein GspK [Candidatus Omnitrophota bacterium]